MLAYFIRIFSTKYNIFIRLPYRGIRGKASLKEVSSTMPQFVLVP